MSLSIFRMLLTIRGFSPLAVNAAGSDGEQYVLLGRDVLNRYTVLLDGPNLRLEIG